MGLSIQEKKFKIDFQDGNSGGHLAFPTGTILAISDLQVTSMTLTKSIGPRVQEKKRKIDFKMPPWWPSWISNHNDFSYFLSTSHPYAS